MSPKSKKCICGRRFNLQSWKKGKELERCFSCLVALRTAYEVIAFRPKLYDYLTEEQISETIIKVSNPLGIGRK